MTVPPRLIEALHRALREQIPVYGEMYGTRVSLAEWGECDLDLAPLVEAVLAAQWRPIETAPRDGAMVLLASPMPQGHDVSYGYWTGRAWWIATWGNECLDREALNTGVGGWPFVAAAVAPTHWQPLGAPPTPA